MKQARLQLQREADRLKNEAMVVFDAIDVDGSGSLSFNELSGRLSDFGLADEEVENLFFKLDADHSGQVERDEFVAGYRSYLDKLNGKPQVVLEKGDWRVWNEIDQAEERGFHQLSLFYHMLQENADSFHGGPPEVVAPESPHMQPQPISELTVAVDYTGIQLDNPLQPGSARDLLQSFLAGQPLAEKFALSLLEQASAILEAQPNRSVLPAPTALEPLTIVGDLHGNLQDLNAIFQKYGTPDSASKRRFLFNGDFVDRGHQGVEVMLVLLAFKVLHPQYCFLNRGNHEDILINEAYGFSQEVIMKYSKRALSAFKDCFSRVPLCATVGGDGGIFVVHGGIFSDPNVTMEMIDSFDRTAYPSVCGVHPNPTVGLTLMQEMMWSDPTEDGSDGCFPSFRGTGIEFGPDVVAKFLRKHNFKTLVRSHEAIEEGVELSRAGEGPLCNLPPGLSMYTVFSASNYSDGANDAAVLHWRDLMDPEVYRFRTSETPGHGKVARRNRVKITELICRRHHRLLRSFQKVDPDGTLTVTLEKWIEVMETTLNLKLNWGALQPQLAPEQHGVINYGDFLEQYSMQKLGKAEVPSEMRPALASLYDHFHMLKAVFTRWDKNHDGQVDRSEFLRGVDVLNKVLQEKSNDHADLDGGALFDLCDLDNSETIELDEFCECYRLLSATI